MEKGNPGLSCRPFPDGWSVRTLFQSKRWRVTSCLDLRSLLTLMRSRTSGCDNCHALTKACGLCTQSTRRYYYAACALLCVGSLDGTSVVQVYVSQSVSARPTPRLCALGQLGITARSNDCETPQSSIPARSVTMSLLLRSGSGAASSICMPPSSDYPARAAGTHCGQPSVAHRCRVVSARLCRDSGRDSVRAPLPLRWPPGL